MRRLCWVRAGRAAAAAAADALQRLQLRLGGFLTERSLSATQGGRGQNPPMRPPAPPARPPARARAHFLAPKMA